MNIDKNNHMFDIHLGAANEVVMTGRLDATQCERALQFLNGVSAPDLIDLTGLEYIASAGLRVLLMTQKRAKATGPGIRLINLQPQIHEIFRYAGFDRIIDISPVPRPPRP